ncbi:CoA ester lyase [Betaproteobacteria bacterium PRO7]|nr:CoA ester lyase [Betaproteobacteria bacterium PRO7]
MTAEASHTARSLLFVPATRPDRIGKALASGADIAIIDLEDAVAAADKDAARAALAGAAHRAAVRINAVGTPWFDGDLAACRAARVPIVVLPKAEHPSHAQRVRAALPEAAVIAIVETAAGFENIDAIARTDVARLAFGSLDLQVDLGIDDDGEPLHYFRARIVLASRLGGLPPPVDGVCTALDDEARLAAELARARRFGFGAKLCIHPKQIAAVHAAFAPTEAEVAWAQRVLAASASGAAARVDGEMVDAPVVARARRILQRAQGI